MGLCLLHRAQFDPVQDPVAKFKPACADCSCVRDLGLMLSERNRSPLSGSGTPARPGHANPSLLLLMPSFCKCALLAIPLMFAGAFGFGAPPRQDPATQRAAGDFAAEMSRIQQAGELAQAGQPARAAQVLCAGATAEQIGWRASMATGRLRENNCYAAAEALAAAVLERAEADPSRLEAGPMRARAHYWRARLVTEFLDRPLEADAALRLAEEQSPDDPEIRALRKRVNAVAAARAARVQGGRQ